MLLPLWTLDTTALAAKIWIINLLNSWLPLRPAARYLYVHCCMHVLRCYQEQLQLNGLTIFQSKGNILHHLDRTGRKLYYPVYKGCYVLSVKKFLMFFKMVMQWSNKKRNRYSGRGSSGNFGSILWSKSWGWQIVDIWITSKMIEATAIDTHMLANL